MVKILPSGSHLLPVALAEAAQKQNNEGIELRDLLLVVIFQGVLIPSIALYYFSLNLG